ncbi:hypothetical protein GCM10009665_31240 [Kitasatospora nipponensis]|uniref:N-acetyltransferase domain-containing protein n=1 Tax=Kitasatospora nipponensis TaxID=258049 RepID=A0ABN1W7C8_9ACTN
MRRAHTDEQVHDWFRHVVVPRLETWLAATPEGEVIGLLVLDEGSLDQLYLEPQRRGQGVGDALVELAKRQRPQGLELWTFQVNGPAQRFYRRHGFTEAERTDGSGNEEREPDVRLVWRPQAG